MTPPISLRDLATDADPVVVCLAEALQEAIAALEFYESTDEADNQRAGYASPSRAAAALASIREKVSS